ncbi:D-arabinose 5-phosphate isomerase [Escherichia coli]|nr:D-arabinose 5-phosphate isomerase [Escherichia coli]
MSEALLNAGRQTLMLELQEASRLPERLGDDFVRAANIILHCGRQSGGFGNWQIGPHW